MIVILVFHDSNWSVSARTVYSLHTLHWYTARFQWVLVRSVTGRIENWKMAFRLPQQYRWFIMPDDISWWFCSCGYASWHNIFHQSLWSHSQGYCMIYWKFLGGRLRQQTVPGICWVGSCAFVFRSFWLWRYSNRSDLDISWWVWTVWVLQCFLWPDLTRILETDWLRLSLRALGM